MRRRDLHYLLTNVALTVCGLLACALAVFEAVSVSRRSRARLDAFEERLAASERTVADACGAAMAAAEACATSPASDGSPDAATPPRILGFGQGRTSTGRRYVYCDVEQDGQTRREYVAWLPATGGVEGSKRPPLEPALESSSEARSAEPSRPNVPRGTIAPEGAITGLDESGALCETVPR